jgi:Sulfotransferase family
MAKTTVSESIDTAHAPETEAQAASSQEPAPPFADHVERRTVVLPEQRILFLPMPKAGCTSVLWLLADLVGIPAETFSQSSLPEVSPALTIHDMNLWGEGQRLGDYAGEERERVLTEEGWFRFSVVRHPAPRLWSAWQSKLLLREPRFLATFGEQPWFPRLPDEPDDLIEDFRRFVAALPGGSAEDVHWAVQWQLAAQLPLTHVGRLNALEETLALLRAHLSEDVELPAGNEENRMALPLPPGAYDDVARQVLHDRYRDDFEHFGFALVEPVEDEEETARWQESVRPLMPMLTDMIDKNTRIGQLHRIARRANSAERQLEGASSRRVGHAQSPVLTNLEGFGDFNVRWAWAEAKTEPGFTAVVRVKNEARALPWVLPPLLAAVAQVVLVDNGSTDGTAAVAREAAAKVGAGERLEVRDYPFDVARCGEEHLGTPAESVHSLAYFYNWAFSHVRTAYALKWDGDMVLADAAVGALRDLVWQLQGSQVVVRIPRYPLYIADDKHAFLDIGLSNCEPWAWPNRPGYSFVKAMEWEQPILPPGLPRIILPDWSCVELKFLDADEFDHWTATDFDASERTQRKRREWEVFRALADGAEPPGDVVAIEAPEGVHVIEHVRSTWLPEREKQPGDRTERILRQLARL